VLDSTGKSHNLCEYWEAADKGIALVFVRHFSCPFCREHVKGPKRHRSRFLAAGIDVIVVGNGSSGQARVFSHEMQTPFPVLTDPTGSAYHAFGLGKASKAAMLEPRALLGGIRAAIKGHFPKRPQGDPLQLQGQFLIDSNGIIWHADRPSRMSDIPSADALLDTAHIIWET
jgi:hypothetical protein